MLRLAFVLFCQWVSLFAWSQSKVPDSYVRVIEAVIEDAPREFVHSKGKPLANGVFESNQRMPGAETAAILSSAANNSLAWFSYYPEVRSRGSADLTYNKLFSALSNALLQIGGTAYILNGTASNCVHADQIRCSVFGLIPRKDIAAKISVKLLMLSRNGLYRVEVIVTDRPGS